MNKRRSRRPLTLKMLEYAADAKTADLVWPTPNVNFDAVSSGLRKTLEVAVMDVTWDSSGLEDWLWNPYDQIFDFTVHSVFRMGPDIDSRPVSMTSRFSFDPKEDWLVELDRVSDQIKTYSEGLLLMQRAYLAAVKTS